MKLLSIIKRDIRVVFERDPAAKTIIEVLLCYPGLHAIWFYRLSHYFYRRNWVVISRLISHLARFLTGIEIHPGAEIGPGLFIDHGSGIVIGETTIIGKNVTLYQGVTLGGTGKEKGKRHPTIGNNVVVACGAKVLGSFKVGDHAKIGSGSVVLKEVPPYATVVGIPGRVILMKGEKIEKPKKDVEISPKLRELAEELDVDLSHDKLPDPELDMIKTLSSRISDLQLQIEKLQKELEDSKINHA